MLFFGYHYHSFHWHITIIRIWTQFNSYLSKNHHSPAPRFAAGGIGCSSRDTWPLHTGGEWAEPGGWRHPSMTHAAQIYAAGTGTALRLYFFFLGFHLHIYQNFFIALVRQTCGYMDSFPAWGTSAGACLGDGKTRLSWSLFWYINNLMYLLRKELS